MSPSSKKSHITTEKNSIENQLVNERDTELYDYEEILNLLRRMGIELESTSRGISYKFHYIADAIVALYKENKAYELMISQLESRIPHWISVDEKLPSVTANQPNYRRYLVYEDGYIQIADWSYEKDGSGPAFFIYGEYTSRVTHWCEIPLSRNPEEMIS